MASENDNMDVEIFQQDCSFRHNNPYSEGRNSFCKSEKQDFLLAFRKYLMLGFTEQYNKRDNVKPRRYP